MALSACSPSLSTDRKPAYGAAITGVVEPLVGLLAQAPHGNGKTFFSAMPVFPVADAQAFDGCNSSDVKVRLYLLSPITGDPGVDPVQTVNVAPDGSFAIPNPKDLGVRVGEQVNAMVEVSGCVPDLTHSRLITDYVDHEVNSASSLIASILDLDLAAKRKVQSLPPKELEEFIREFRRKLGNVVRVSDAYAALQNDSDLSRKFVSVFYLSASAMKYSAPRVELLSFPTAGREKEALNYSVSAIHWDPEYWKIHLWKLDDAIASTSQYFYNFILSEDRTKIFYIRSDGKLFCRNLSGSEPQCSDTVELNPTSGAMRFLMNTTFGANQMTWKDANTLLISDYNGQIFQYVFTP